MAFIKQPKKRCRTCKHCDREAYRGTGTIVCYQLSKSPWGERAATTIKEDRETCRRYAENA